MKILLLLLLSGCAIYPSPPYYDENRVEKANLMIRRLMPYAQEDAIFRSRMGMDCRDADLAVYDAFVWLQDDWRRYH